MSPALVKSTVPKGEGGRDLWRTPPDMLEAVREAFRAVLSADCGQPVGPALNPIGLDPCSGEGSIVGAMREIRPPDDGLAAAWAESGTVYVNPPYSRGNLGPWTLKCAVEASRDGAEVIALVPFDPSLRWWNEAVRGAAGCVLVWPRRARFLDSPGGANFPSAFVYWGRHADAVADAWRKFGSVWTRP